MKVLNFGSLNIDYVYSLDHFARKGETISSDSLDIFSGGKGLNQSIALGRAGACVFHAGAVGSDGEFLIRLMEESGVDTRFVKRLDTVRTGNAIIQRNKAGDNCIILYGGANRSITREQVDETLKFFEAGDYLVLQNEINEMAYIMEAASKKGMKLVLNPSPMDEQMLSAPLSLVDLFLLNEIEAGQILGCESTAVENGEDLCAQLAKRFPDASIVLTLGEKGSIYMGQGETICQSIYRTNTVDTTAAGDTFTGYFVSGILKGLPVKEAMDLASKASSIAVSRLGAAPSIPCLKEVEG